MREATKRSALDINVKIYSGYKIILDCQYNYLMEDDYYFLIPPMMEDGKPYYANEQIYAEIKYQSLAGEKIFYKYIYNRDAISMDGLRFEREKKKLLSKFRKTDPRSITRVPALHFYIGKYKGRETYRIAIPIDSRKFYHPFPYE